MLVQKLGFSPGAGSKMAELPRVSGGTIFGTSLAPPSASISYTVVPVAGDSSRRTRGRLCGLARDILSSQRDTIEGEPLKFLEVTEAYWKALKASKHEPQKKGPTVVRETPQESLGHIDYDVVVCGGTLGLMIGTTLAKRGHRVAVVDKRLIQGRTQEWNISMGELQALQHVGLLTESELRSCIASEFNPVRVGFAGGPQMWVNDCLNLGVSPRKLLDLIKAKFVAAGGALLENHSFRSADVVRGEGVRLKLIVHGAGTAGAAVGLGDVNRPNGLGGNSSNLAPPFTRPESDVRQPTPAGLGGGPSRMQLNCRVLLDCMGHYSDIVKQMRGKAKPDGMCLVVGSCADGFPTDNNTFGDLLYTIDNAENDMQMFWEAFPAEGGAARTTYMFAYSDAEPARPSFEALLDKYFNSLEKYQGVPVSALRFKRVLFGGFPCWSNGPLAPAWDHIIQVGDASATQSPLSFGGFGAMLRHLGRLTEGLDDALRCGALSKEDLALLHPYQPSLSASWLFQRSMSVGVGQLGPPQQPQHGASPASGDHSTAAAAAADGATSSGQQQQHSTSGGGGGGGFKLQFPADHVNQVLACNFSVMKVLGDRVLRPFLQDTIQLVPLSLSMTLMMFANPVAISRVLLQVGPKTLFGWFGHYFALLAYTGLHWLLTPLRQAVRSSAGRGARGAALQLQAQERQMLQAQGIVPSSEEGRPQSLFWLRRMFDTLEYGSGSDYSYHPSTSTPVAPHYTMMWPSGEWPAPGGAPAGAPAGAGAADGQQQQPPAARQQAPDNKGNDGRNPPRQPTPVPVPIEVARRK